MDRAVAAPPRKPPDVPDRAARLTRGAWPRVLLIVGGLSAGNHMSITGAPPATATRDLAGLVLLGVLRRSGDRKAARYQLNVPRPPS